MENTITREELESIGEELFDEIARRNIDRSDVSKARKMDKAVFFDPATGMFKANVVKNPNDRLILPVVAPRIPMTGTFWNLSDGRDPGVNTIQ